MVRSERAGQAGLRRGDWVRLVVDDERVRAEAVGVGFRVPVTCPIPLSVAVRLIARGIPLVTRTAHGSGGDR